MTIPNEISQPIKEFISNNWLVLLIIICALIGCASAAFLGINNNKEKEFEIVVEAETE